MFTSNPAAFYNELGQIVFTCSDSGTLVPPDFPRIDLTNVEYESLVSWSSYVKDGVIHAKPDQPSPSHEWDWPTFSWVLNLSDAKTKAKDRITEARNVEEASGFIAFGKVLDSDSNAVQRISVAVQAANAVGESYIVDWACKDNTTITLDYWMMLALPAVMANAANTLHIKARTLKEQIDAAVSLEEINAIVW